MTRGKLSPATISSPRKLVLAGSSTPWGVVGFGLGVAAACVVVLVVTAAVLVALVAFVVVAAAVVVVTAALLLVVVAALAQELMRTRAQRLAPNCRNRFFSLDAECVNIFIALPSL